MKLTTNDIQTMLADFNNQSYNYPAKQRFGKLGKKLAKIIVEKLGLSEGQYKINVNHGGIAVGTEVTIYTPFVFIDLGPTLLANDVFMWRTCDKLGDCGAGLQHHNRWENLTTTLLDVDGFVRKVNQVRKDFCPTGSWPIRLGDFIGKNS